MKKSRRASSHLIRATVKLSPFPSPVSAANFREQPFAGPALSSGGDDSDHVPAVSSSSLSALRELQVVAPFVIVDGVFANVGMSITQVCDGNRPIGLAAMPTNDFVLKSVGHGERAGAIFVTE